MRGRTLQVEGVAIAGTGTVDGLQIIGACGSFHILRNGDADGGVDLVIDQDNVETGRVGIDACPGDLVVLAQIECRAQGRAGDQEGRGRRQEGNQGRRGEGEMHLWGVTQLVLQETKW